MSFDSEYLELRKKRKEREQQRLKEISEQQNINTQTEEKLDFFQKGVFDDGYQAGDISKAILGTVGDIGLSLFKGMSSLGEGLLDTVGYAAAGVADLLGKKGWADDIKRYTQDSYTDDMFYIPNAAVEDKSVLGRTSQAILEGVGQAAGIVATAGVGGAAGLSTKGVTALTSTVTGLSGFGSGMSEAYQSGATDEEAVTYGMISAASDVLTEMLFGGLGKGAKAIGISKGLSSADDMLAKKVSNMFSSQIAKNISEFGVKAGAEGVEEVLAGIMQAVGKKMTYMSEEELTKILKDENLLEQFVVGMASSGFMQAGDLHTSNKTKTDFITGLSQNEQAVFDKVYKDRVKEATEGGKKLSGKDKSNIYDSVLNDLEKGYIGIDTIESVLGGETYKQYQSAVEKDNQMKELQKEYDTLYKMKNGEKSDEQIDRQKSLKQQLEEYRSTSKLTELKDQLSNEVSELAKVGKLNESYNEKARRSQAFEADLTKYDVKAQETVKRAIDSGILNNTNRTHEFVDMIAKLSADKGVPFDFTNNTKLKESGFAIEGKQVNGYVQGNNIAINIDSTSALNKVVGHEITHILEGTELYTELVNAVKELATTKGEYDSKLQSIAKLYEGVEDANIENELTADLIGEYLFTDSDFINRLSAEKPTLFQKIFDEIKYLCKVATAGSKEAKQLEKVKKTFEEAYRQKNNTATDDSVVKYSFNDSKTGMANDKLMPYDEELTSIIEQKGGFIIDSYEKLENVVNLAFDNPQQKATAYFGILSPDTLLDIEKSIPNLPKELSGTLFKKGKGYSITTSFDNIRHLVENKASLTRDDVIAYLDRLADTIADFDTVDFDYYYDGVGKKNNGILFKKQFEDGVNITFNIVSNKKRSLNLITAYMDKADYKKKKSAETLLMQNAPAHTLEAGVGQTSNNIISNSTENVKEYSLSDNAKDIEPVGNGNVYGEDIKLQHASAEDIAPIGEDVIKTPTTEKSIIYGDEPIKAPHSAETNKSSTHEDLVHQMSDIMDETDESDTEANTVSQEFIDHSNKSFGIEKPNDYVHVQKQVFNTLKNEGFFTGEDNRRIDYNEGSGMVIETNKKGIKETFNGDNYSNLGKEKKALKLATIRKLPEIIKNGKLIADDVDNYHNKSSVTRFAYIESEIEVDGKDVSVKIDIKKSPQKNKFWVHSVQILEKANEQPAVASGAIKRANDSSAYEDSVPNPTEDVKEDLPDYFLEGENKQETKLTRKALHSNIIEGFKSAFKKDGFDLDEVLNSGKRHSALFNNDNTPQRVMEKTFGYKAGKILADLTVNKIAQNETEAIKWLNTITGKKGLLRKLSKEYNIKPYSKEDAAAHKYLEGFYVNESDEYVRYGDAELAADFPDRNVRENIRLFAKDPRIREFYDLSLNLINEARVRNCYDPIPRRDNYALHFRAMEDVFSKIGVPLNPNDIKAKDLPTDLNGVTVDLKPGQPYFASAKHRTGVKTTYSLLGGMERYANSAKNQIYHIDDIQNLRALRNYIADTFGQAKGLEGLDELTASEMQERLKLVYNGHLSNFAAWLNEEANHVAGKTALMDRAIEGAFGRRGLQVLSNLNGMVGSNQVGFNFSSSLTNIIPIVQTFARTNKFDFAKAFSQTVLNTARRFSGNDDGFAEKSPVMIRRKGAESFAKTPYQKATDAGYVFMSAVDGVATELVARTKFNEYTRKGMDEQKAHIETDKWVSKLMGDRSLGQQPLLYNSKTLGLFTKYQLEVRNQLDSMFYDTLQERKEEYENIESNLEKNAKTAAKYTATLFELAVAQNIFGAAFEAMAGYNPAFDIIEVILKACGYDDEEDSEDDVLDNLEQAFMELLGDLPYSNLYTGGGRIPVQAALPIKEFVDGKDQYGNEKSRVETVLDALPYYILPTGYGQVKKTAQGLSMFNDVRELIPEPIRDFTADVRHDLSSARDTTDSSVKKKILNEAVNIVPNLDDLPISGSYTDSGKLRFSVDETMDEMIKAGFFGQYASKTARQYFDEERAPLSDKQTKELVDLDIPIADYWKYRDGLKALGEDATLSEKVAYIADLEEFDTRQKNIMANNLTTRKDPIDLTDYDKYGDLEELDYAVKNPGKYAVSKSVGGYSEYIKYSEHLNNITSEKNAKGETVSGSRKIKVARYINNLDIDYGEKIILYRSQYKSDDTYNTQIIDYLNSRDDISRKEMEIILKELGFEVYADGTVRW